MNVPIETLWAWHDVAQKLRDDAERADEINLSEDAEQLRAAIDKFILNAPPPEAGEKA